MSHRFDATVKDMIDENSPDYSDHFGVPPGEHVETVNVDLSTISAATDVVLAIGKPVREYIDINAQSGPDGKLSRRALMYNTVLFHRYDVPVRTIILLLSRKADHPSLTGSLAYASGNTSLQWEYEVIRMWEEPVEAYLKGGIGLLPLAPLCRIPDDQEPEAWLRQTVLEVAARLDRECTPAQAAKLMTAAFILTGLRVERNELPTIFQGVGNMHQSSAYQMILDEGEAKGIEKGIVNTLARQAKRRFGTPLDVAITKLVAVTDPQRLERMTDAIFSARNWEEFLETP